MLRIVYLDNDMLVSSGHLCWVWHALLFAFGGINAWTWQVSELDPCLAPAHPRMCFHQHRRVSVAGPLAGEDSD